MKFAYGVLAALTFSGCASPTMPLPPVASGVDPVTANTRPTAIRGSRYCEVLVVARSGLKLGIEVYTTFGLNDCPDASWRALDPTALQAQLDAAAIVLNGPRYWTFDRMENTKLIDRTPRQLGGLAMRLAGRLERSLLDTDVPPYSFVQVARTTVWIYEAGAPVYELTDPEGNTYLMQSFSTQNVPQTMASLATLGERLRPPAGWSFRTRVPTETIAVEAFDGVAVVTQDELKNTYQRAAAGPRR